MYSCVSLLLLAGNLSREHMIRITIVRLVGKIQFRSDYDISGHDKASFPKIRFIRVGYVIVKDFCHFFGMLYLNLNQTVLGNRLSFSEIGHYSL